jgi:RNA polymerase sigma-70 factor (ECF subfamily)
VEWQTTSTILSRLRANDATAWSLFVDRFRQPIIRFCQRSGLSNHDAEDVAQETLAAFASGYRDGKYDRQRGRLSGWLFGIAYHQILRERQRQAQRAKTAAQVATSGFWEVLPDETEAAELWDLQWEQSLLQECINLARSDFEPTTIRAFELSVQGQQPAAAVSEALGVPVKTIYNAKHRVLRRIRELREQFEDFE